MEALLKRVASARSKEDAARNELVEAMRLARAQGASIREIARAAGLSHTHVGALLRGGSQNQSERSS